MNFKKVLSTILAVSMLSSTLPISVMADNTEEAVIPEETVVVETQSEEEATQTPASEDELSEDTEDILETEQDSVEEEVVLDFGLEEEYIQEEGLMLTAVSDGLINLLYETDFEDGTVGETRQMGQTNTQNTSDPDAQRDNKVLRLWSKGTTKDPYNNYINARIGGTAQIGDVWGSGKWGSTYEEVGTMANIPLVYEMDFYFSEEIKSQLKSPNGFNPSLIFGPLMTTSNPGNEQTVLNIGIDTITSGQGFTGHAAAQAWLGTDNWQKKCEMKFDQWYKFMWVITGEGSNTKVSIFMSSDGGETYTRLYNGVTASKQYNRTTTLMHGIQVSSKQALGYDDTATSEDESSGVYVDNIKIYQVIEQDAEFEVADTTSVDMEKGIVVDLKHSIPVDKLKDLFTIEHDGEVITKATVSAIEGEPSKVLITSDILEGSTDYTIYFEGYTHGTKYVESNSVNITTKSPSTMKVSSDVAQNATVPSGENTVTLSFSQNVTTEAVKAAMSLVDEDGISQSFTVIQESERIIKVNMKLVELCGFTLTLDENLLSDTDPALPLESDFVLNFRTEMSKEVTEEDPYDSPEHKDSILITTDEAANAGKWWLSDPTTAIVEAIANGARISVTNSDASVTAIPNATSSSDFYEAGEKKYPHASVMTFEYDIKLPDLATTESLTTTFEFNATNDHAQDEQWKDIGTWQPKFTITYNANGVTAQKNSAASSVMKLYTADEMAAKDTLHIKLSIDVETGIVSLQREDGEIRTVDMNTSVNWGDTDFYMNWSPYMYVRNIKFACKAQRRTTAQYEVTNLYVKRVTKTLGVDSASFEHGEYYVDTDNMAVTFNEEIDLSNLQKAVYITDENGDKVQNCEITVTGEGKEYSIAVKGLEAYTRYNLNIEGLSAINERMMSGRFERGFVTKKANSVFVDTKDENAILNTYGNRLAKLNKLDYTMVIKNYGGTAQDMIGAVAVYDINDGLLAVKYQDVTVGNNVFNLTDIPSGAERVKVYAWEKNTDGTIGALLHEPDVLKQESEKAVYELKYEKTLPAFENGVADSVKGVAYISGKTSDADGVYTILVLDGENTPLTEASSKTLALVYANVESGESGNVFGSTFAFNAPSGTYTAYVITDSKANQQEFGYIILSDLVNDFVKPLASGAVAQNMIYEKINEYNAGIGIDFSKDFVSDRDKALLEKRLYEKKNLLVGPADIDYMNQLVENIEFAREEIKYLDELKAIEYEGLIEDKLKAGVEYTNIDFTAYNKLSSAKKSAVRASLLGKSFADGDALKDAFDDAVKNPPSTNIDKKPTTGPGFSGGGGGSSTSVTPSILTPQKEVTADDVFTDMGNHAWAKDAVLYLAKRNIVNGVSNDKFDPSGLVTREQIAKMTVLAANIYNENAAADFEDVDLTQWYAVYVASAKKKGIINGISETEFGVGRYITRQEMATIIYRTLAESKYTFTSERVDFADISEVDEYAVEAVKTLGAEGIIKGMTDGTFAPKKYATRAEAAMLIKSLVEGVN